MFVATLARRGIGALVLGLAVLLILPAVALADPVTVEDSAFTYYRADGSLADIAVYPGPATWLTYAYADFSGGGNHFSGTPGAYAELKFTGTSVSFISTIGDNRGDVAIYLDGVHQGTFSEYSLPLITKQVLWSRSGLAPVEHTLKVVCVGSGPSNTDYAEIDAIEYEPVPPPVVSTPASSPWALALLVLGAAGVAGFSKRRLAA